jgi:predicted transcriptional regulator
MEGTVTVQLDQDTLESVDLIATTTNQERSEVVSQALKAYIELFQWQVEHIREGVRQADAGEFVPEEEVRRVLSRLTNSR